MHSENQGFDLWVFASVLGAIDERERERVLTFKCDKARQRAGRVSLFPLAAAENTSTFLTQEKK